MSRSSSLLRHVVSDTPDAAALKAQNQVTLIDHTTPDRRSGTTSEDGLSDVERVNTQADTTSSTEPLYSKISRTSLQNSVRHQVNRQKYRRYQQHRYSGSAAPPDDEAAGPTQEGEEATPAQKGYLERGKARAKKVLNRKKTLGRADLEDSVIDILYENQRGAFFFGIPMFSTSSLLNFDPKPWQNAAFRTSPSDIRNAQVPDPSWTWDWKSWYVDMSRDVDEEGWEYSFSFQKGFAWHGNHPWFHSFVRRRRWLRKRVRKNTSHKTKERSHELNADYFTIHPKTIRGPSPNRSISYSALRARGFQNDDNISVKDADVADIGTLIRVLRKAAVDREKLVAVRKFIDQGGEELFYLSDHMSDIMALFVYQSSRRHLLAELIHHFDSTSARKDSLSGHMHSDEETKRQHEAAVKQANNLRRAVEAADEQVKRLEYWSDIKSMARHGEALHATDNDHWNPTKWQGIDPASPAHDEDPFRSKQHHAQPAPALSTETEHDDRRDKQHSSETDASGYVTAATTASKAKSLHRKNTAETETDGEIYITAPERPLTVDPIQRSMKKKGKSKATGIDGAVEEDSEGEAHAEALAEDEAAEEARDEEPVFKDAKEVQSIAPGTSLDDEESEPVSLNGAKTEDPMIEVVEPKAIDADYDESPVIV